MYNIDVKKRLNKNFKKFKNVKSEEKNFKKHL